jgi:hypothetical protein
MRDPCLVKLNFQELLHYGGQPRVCYEHKPPIPCNGYCVDCEGTEPGKGLLEGTGMRLDLMSHGCDSSDYEAVLGEMPAKGLPVTRPALFLLENPGGDYDFSEQTEFGPFKKGPPVKHYYWIPKLTSWPTTYKDVDRDFYNSYFAYLMWKHQLTCVYITNLVKCKEIKDSDNTENPPNRRHWQRVVENCTRRYLARELTILAETKTGPVRWAFCFGRKAEKGLLRLLAQDTALNRLLGNEFGIIYLYHPAAFRRAAALGKTPESMFCENDERIAKEIIGNPLAPGAR